MILLYLFDRSIRVVDGEHSRGRVKVRRVCSAEDTQGCMINGNIMDREGLSALISDLWERENLPKKDVYLVLSSTQIMTKEIDAPLLKKTQMDEFVRREFSDVERITDPVIMYFPMPGYLDKRTKTQRLFAQVASKKLLKEYVELFSEIGIRLSGIEGIRGAVIRLITALGSMKDRTCIVQIADASMLINIILHNGKFVYSGRVRLFSDAGTPEYAVEMARSVSNVLQFAKSQDISETITEVYVSGISQDIMELYVDSVHRINEEMNVQEMDLSVDIGIADDVDRALLRECTSCIGALWPVDEKNGFLRELSRDPEKEKARAQMRRTVLPVAALTLVLVGVSGFFGLRVLTLHRQLEEVRAYNQREDVLAACADYDRLSREIGSIRTLIGSAEGLEEMVKSYPMADSSVDRVIAACAEGLVESEISSYRAGDGVLNMTTKAGNVELIHMFVKRLEAQEIFSRVNYTGYHQTSDGVWSVTVQCTMAGREVQSDEAGNEAD